MADTTAERQARYREKMRREGHVRVSEWVPKERAKELRRIAQGMRQEKNYSAMLDMPVLAE
jgi:hypothetical protein